MCPSCPPCIHVMTKDGSYLSGSGEVTDKAPLSLVILLFGRTIIICSLGVAKTLLGLKIILISLQSSQLLRGLQILL